MVWYYEASLLALVVVITLLFDIHSNSSRSFVLTNSIFKTIAWLTFVLTLSDCLIAIISDFGTRLPCVFLDIACIAYYLSFPLLALYWLYYCLSIVLPDQKTISRYLIPFFVIYGIYAILVLSSPWTNLFFSVDGSNMYRRGLLFPGFIALLGLYILGSIVTMGWWFSRMERHKAFVMLVYPVIAIFSLVVQVFEPLYSWGATGYCFLLLFIYLNIQNRKFSYDTMTGVPNRNAFILKMDQELKRGKEGEVCLLALDSFKFFNQKFGQDNGDLLLKEVASYLSSVSPSNCVYRYSGDQFVCIICGENSHERCDEFIRTVTHRFSSVWDLGSGMNGNGQAAGTVMSTLSLSIVTVMFPQQAGSSTEVTNALDFALLEAKSRGKAQIVAYDFSLVSKRRRKHDVLIALTRAVVEESFELYYQPIIETKTGHMLSAEALLRLNDPVLGWISPLELIPVAEENGLVVSLTYKIIKRVCQLWNSLGEQKGHLKSIAVNLSSVHFLQEDMGTKILETIEQNHGDPKHIKFEVTESMVIDSYSEIRSVMEYLVGKGIGFALDDFGQGYSSLNNLLELPFSTVKLDRSIIRQSDKHGELLDSIVLLLNRLDKKVVAEGVENAKQLELIKRLDIGQVQGFYYCCPVPESEFVKLVQEDTGPDYSFTPRYCLGDSVSCR